ncbi:hypothetical protein D3C87_1826110 [compost metagenome]
MKNSIGFIKRIKESGFRLKIHAFTIRIMINAIPANVPKGVKETGLILMNPDRAGEIVSESVSFFLLQINTVLSAMPGLP